MNKKDIAQIRRRLNPESQNPVVICGCYVNGQKNVVSAFRRSLISLPQSESENTCRFSAARCPATWDATSCR